MKKRRLLHNFSQLLIGVLTLGRYCGSVDWTCPPWTGSQGLFLVHKQLCFFRSDFKMKWDEAESYCRKHGGILAKETSEETTSFFKRQLLVNMRKMDKILCFWIGLNDKGDTGNWRWSDGEKAVYTNWSFYNVLVGWLGERLFDCCGNCASSVDKYGFRTWVWNEEPCGNDRRFLCQFDAVPVESLRTVPISESSVEPVSAKPRSPKPTVSVTRVIHLASEKGARLSTTPDWTMKALTATMCARRCQDPGSTCQVFNYNHVTKQCHAYSTESVTGEGRIMEEGWSVWKLSVIVF